MSTGRILVIAANPDLAKSVAFALEAEGYEVVSRDAVTAAGEEEYDCVVLDHRAARLAGPAPVLEFCAAAGKVVLLAGSPLPWLTEKVFAVVNTPHLGEPLISAVNAAVNADAVLAGRR